jgi:hypothetical protein
MTPLEYIATNPSYAEARTKWLVFSPALKDAMLAKQDTIQTSHRISPIELTDGRWAVCCDLVTEINGGVFTPLFAALDQAALNTATIIEQSEFETLLPEPENII